MALVRDSDKTRRSCRFVRNSREVQTILSTRSTPVMIPQERSLGKSRSRREPRLRPDWEDEWDMMKMRRMSSTICVLPRTEFWESRQYCKETTELRDFK